MLVQVNSRNLNQRRDYRTYNVCNSDNDPICLDSTPIRFMFVKDLKLGESRLITLDRTSNFPKEGRKQNRSRIYMEITREPLHTIPTQPPQGSGLSQLDGIFCQSRDNRAFTAIIKLQFPSFQKIDNLQTRRGGFN